MPAISFNFISSNAKGLKNESNYLIILNQKLLPVVFSLLKKHIQPRKSNKNGKMNLMAKNFFCIGNPIRVMFL